MKKILMVLFTACLFIAGKPVKTVFENSNDNSKLIIKEWHITKLANDSYYYVITGAFNLSTQQFSNGVTAYKVGIPWPEYSVSLSVDIEGSTLFNPGTHVDIFRGRCNNRNERYNVFYNLK